MLKKMFLFAVLFSSCFATHASNFQQYKMPKNNELSLMYYADIKCEQGPFNIVPQASFTSTRTHGDYILKIENELPVMYHSRVVDPESYPLIPKHVWNEPANYLVPVAQMDIFFAVVSQSRKTGIPRYNLTKIDNIDTAKLQILGNLSEVLGITEESLQEKKSLRFLKENRFGSSFCAFEFSQETAQQLYEYKLKLHPQMKSDNLKNNHIPRLVLFTNDSKKQTKESPRKGIERNNTISLFVHKSRKHIDNDKDWVTFICIVYSVLRDLRA